MLTPYQNTIVQLAVITALPAATHVVLTDWGGQLCLAQPALAGLGAVCAARVSTGLGLPLLPALAIGVLAAAVGGALLGLAPAAGITGMRFAVLTLAFGAACSGTLLTWTTFSGDAADRTLDPPTFVGLDLTGSRFTVAVVIVAAAAFLVLRRFGNSRPGAALIAAREHDRAAAGLRIPVRTVRWVATTVAGALAGLASGLTAFQVGTVAPEQFHPLTALPILAAAVVGGIGSLWGAVVGATILTIAPE